MPRKMSRNALCAFCGAPTDESADYVEVKVTSPAAIGPQRQLLGAHAACLSDAMKGSGTQIYLDFLEAD